MAPGVQRVALGERDHAIHQRLHGLGFGNSRNDALVLDDAGHQSFEQRIARAHIALEFVAASSVSHVKFPTRPAAPTRADLPRRATFRVANRGPAAEALPAYRAHPASCRAT